MNKDLLSPKNDVVFKMLFGTEEHKDLPKALICGMIEKALAELENK